MLGRRIDVAKELFAQCDSGSWTIEKSVLEIIDNAFDANATEVTIEYAGDAKGNSATWTFSDNGDGCPDPGVILQPSDRYDHSKRGRNVSGQWGRGGSFALMWLSNKGLINVVTHNERLKASTKVNWQDMRKFSGAFTPIHPVVADPNEGGRGTVITVETGKKTNAQRIKAISASLGLLYKPMLESGESLIKITYNGKSYDVEPPRPPKFKMLNEADITLPMGLKCSVMIGILDKEEKSDMAGTFCYYGPRLMAKENDFLFKTGTDSGRIYMEIRFEQDECRKCGIVPNLTKDHFEESSRYSQLLNELATAISETFVNVFEAAKAETQRIELTITSKIVADVINDAVKKAQRETREKSYIMDSPGGSGKRQGAGVENKRKASDMQDIETGEEDSTLASNLSVEIANVEIGPAVDLELKSDLIYFKINPNKMPKLDPKEKAGVIISALSTLLHVKIQSVGRKRLSAQGLHQMAELTRLNMYQIIDLIFTTYAEFRRQI